MPTQGQIATATAKAEALATAKQAFNAAQIALNRTDSIQQRTQELIDLLASDGDDTEWPELLQLLAAQKAKRATRANAFSAIYTTHLTAQGEFEAAIDALNS